VKADVTIYVDELFFENFIMNYLILYMTGYFAKINTKWTKLAIGAFIGAIYVILSLIFKIQIYEEIFLKIMLSILIVIVSFDYKKLFDFIKIILIFYLITFAIGGASLGLAYFLNFPKFTHEGVFYVDKFPLQIIVIAIVVVFISLRILSLLLKNRLKIEPLIFPLEIHILGRKTTVDAFLDTGHNVKDPCTGEPVTFVDIYALKEIIPDYIYNLLLNNSEVVYKIKDDRWRTRLRIIPFSTIKQENTMLIGIKTDKIIILRKEKKAEKPEAIIAVCLRQLSESGNYYALIGNNMFYDTKDK
jgi:stage II sporulation protein GA (sporulation sigma-E factor processing peptidase)